jgi:hypothetical protein
MAHGDNVYHRNRINTNDLKGNIRCSKNKYKKPNKYQRYSVTFTAMKSENFDIRGSKCKAF